MSRVGQRVVHPTLGPGLVTRIVDGGRRWVVNFDAHVRVPYDLPPSAFVDGPPTGRAVAVVAPRSRPAQVKAVSSASLDQWQALEALRMGVVPSHGLEQLTVGRKAELQAIGRLAASARGLALFVGGYGSGKSHLIEVADARARAEGMVVARATFDPIEVPPSHPMRLYGELAAGLEYPDVAGRGLRPLLEKLVASPKHVRPDGDRAHPWLTPALWSLVHADADLADDVIAFVEGHPVDIMELRDRLRRAGWRGDGPLALPDYRTFGQVMANLLGGIAAWAADAGYKGLLVSLNEAEYFDALGSTSREMAENVLRYLAIASLPTEALGFDPDEVYRGGHAVHRNVPAVFVEDQPLAVLCAFTPHLGVDAVIQRILEDADAHIHALEEIPPAVLVLLADRVLDLVRAVHPVVAPTKADLKLAWTLVVNGLNNGSITSTRDAARAVVEFWDLFRVDPARARAAVRT